jgi:hypothetical protein
MRRVRGSRGGRTFEATRAGVLAIAASALALGCTEFASGEDVLGEQQSRLEPGSTGANWSCVEGVAPPPPARAPVAAGAVPSAIYSLQFVDLSTGALYPDITGRACGIADPDCLNPVAGPLTVDAEGWIDFPLFEGFTGFIEVKSNVILPTLFYVVEPITANMPPEYPLAVVSIDSVVTLTLLTGVQPLPRTGIFAGRTFDCDGYTAPGVALSINIPGSPYYFLGGLPSGVARVTDSMGLGGFSNLTPGLAILDATLPGARSIAGPQTAVIREGWLSVIFFRPPGGARAEAAL